jgi:hypothetical protein
VPADTPLRFSWTVCASVTWLRCISLRIAGFSYVPRAQSSFLKKNRSRWVLRVLPLPQDQGGSYTGQSLPSKQLYKIHSSSGVSKDKGTASLRPFNMLVRKANVAPLVALG